MLSAPASSDPDDLDPDLAYLDEEEAAALRSSRRGPEKSGTSSAGKTPRFVAELADTLDREADASGGTAAFTTTYRPSRHEAGWLLASLRPFYDQRLVGDVLALVKGGKEASVYRCKTGPAGGDAPFLAAKVYRPQKFRNLRNDKMYREGRSLLTAEGRVAKESDQRTMRAVARKSAFGLEVAHTSWLMHEYVTLEKLHAAGVNVPRPVAAGENAVLMSFGGDEHQAAPTLSEVRLERAEAQTLLSDVLRDIERMLGLNVIHGDLSAYNILYHEGRALLIDFPQVTDPRSNPHARTIFERDVARVCDYFARHGARAPDPAKHAAALWRRHGLPAAAAESFL